MIFRFDALVDNWIYCGNTFVLIGMAYIQYHLGKTFIYVWTVSIGHRLIWIEFGLLEKAQTKSRGIEEEKNQIYADDQDSE